VYPEPVYMTSDQNQVIFQLHDGKQ
jgi:hypothetical protein